MASTATPLWTAILSQPTRTSSNKPLNPSVTRISSSLSRRTVPPTARETSTNNTKYVIQSGGLEKGKEVNWLGSRVNVEGEGITEKRLKDYIEEASCIVKLTNDGGGPRWFCPVGCGVPMLEGIPPLLYLPGIDGTGLGLVRQLDKLGKLFEVWCLHIPVVDQTPFQELVKLVDDIVRSEYCHSPNRPIYLLGESLGACLALAVAARNPDIDLVLILANPATSFSKSPLQQLLALLSFVPVQSLFGISPLLNQMTGDYMRLFLEAAEEGLGQSQATKDLLQDFLSLSSYYSVIADIFPKNSFLWKMEMLQNACAHANSRLHAVKAQTLILSSGMDPLLPSLAEGERLCKVLSRCQVRRFIRSGHFMLLEDAVDLVYTLKSASYYRRGRFHDYITEFLPPTPSEIKRAREQNWWCDPPVSPVILSTLEDEKIVRGLAGFPSEGPTLLVGNHVLLAFDKFLVLEQILTEKNIQVRAMAHPMMFSREKEGKWIDLSFFDILRLMGIVPVSGTNMYKLFESKSHVLLYPGGIREAFHRKGEEYQLFWPEQSEFIRMAARFGAKIVPFASVGEDDILQLLVDYEDLVKIPYFKEEIEALTNEAVKLRTNSSDEVSNQQLYYPVVLPKVPGRLYYLFGKTIETSGRRNELKDKQKAQELYVEVKSQIEECVAYLKEKREKDPYRSIMSRLLYMSTHDSSSEIPTFEL